MTSNALGFASSISIECLDELALERLQMTQYSSSKSACSLQSAHAADFGLPLQHISSSKSECEAEVIDYEDDDLLMLPGISVSNSNLSRSSTFEERELNNLLKSVDVSGASTKVHPSEMSFSESFDQAYDVKFGSGVETCFGGCSLAYVEDEQTQLDLNFFGVDSIKVEEYVEEPDIEEDEIYTPRRTSFQSILRHERIEAQESWFHNICILQTIAGFLEGKERLTFCVAFPSETIIDACGFKAILMESFNSTVGLCHDEEILDGPAAKLKIFGDVVDMRKRYPEQVLNFVMLTCDGQVTVAPVYDDSFVFKVFNDSGNLIHQISMCE